MVVKKGFSILLIFFLLINFSSSLAESAAIDNNSNNTMTSFGDKIKNSSESVQEKTNKILEQNVSFSPFLKEIAGVAFGINQDERISTQNLIVFACFWLILFLIIKQILEFAPFFEKVWIQWTGSAVITALAGISGGLKQVVYFFFGIADFILPLRDWKLLQLAVSVIMLILFFAGSTKIIHILKSKKDIEAAGEEGRSIAQGAKSAELFSRSVEELGK